jgi:hypothetical protein
MSTRMMKDLFTGEIKFIDVHDIPGDLEYRSIDCESLLSAILNSDWL